MINRICQNTHFAFNIWDYNSAKAIVDAAASLHQDVILQTSTSIFKQIDPKPFAEFVKSYSSYKGICAWINLDHCKEKEILLSAINNGWDMIMADGSSLSIDDNISFTNEITTYAHKKGVLVEAEVGQVKGIEDDVIVQQDAIASKDEILKFLEATNVDLIAVAFGNAHGEYKVQPKLRYDLVKYTTSITNKPFVVHGGSGLTDQVLIRLLMIKGIKKINISTDIKLAYKKGLEEAAQKWIQPIIASNIIHDEIVKTTVSKIKLITSAQLQI